MGSSMHMYFGIYFECDAKYEDTLNFEKVCGNCSVYLNFNQNFCSVCGGEAVNKKVFEKTRLDFDIDEINQNIIKVEFYIDKLKTKDYYILNYDGDYSTSPDSEEVIDLNNTKINNSIECFIKDNQDIIDWIEKCYGVDYKIKFGFISYWY